MPRYRIVCTKQMPVDRPPTHAHIVAVGTGTNPEQAETRWSLDEVLSAMDRGDCFYTRGPRSGRDAAVERFHCRPCARVFIRSTPDAVLDNNLDSLRTCQWSR